MEGIITVQDSRENLNQMKQWRAKEATKIAKNQKVENTIDNIVDVAKSVVSFAGTAATVALTVCQVDGPFGEALAVAATPGLVQAVESSRTLLKGIFVNKDVNQIRASMSDVVGNVKNISIPDKNMAQTVQVIGSNAKNDSNVYNNQDMVK